jgi:hypothetical protein
MDTDATSPVDGGDTSVEDTAEVNTEVETEGLEPDQQFDDDGNPIEEPDEDEEVDLDDLKIKVSKDVAAKLKELKEGNLRQADYTKKTQEAAELRKALEAERNNLRETSDAELGAAAQATAIAQQIQAYQKVDWNAWNDQDPFEAQKAFMQFQQLKDAQQQALGRLQHLRNERLSTAQQEAAKRMEEGRRTLSRDIPGWNDDTKAKLIGFAAEYGFSRDELDDLEADPRVARVLHAAFTGREAIGKQQKAQNHVKAQQAQPAATVKARTAPPSGLDDRLSTEEWMKRREKQARQQA